MCGFLYKTFVPDPHCRCTRRVGHVPGPEHHYTKQWDLTRTATARDVCWHVPGARLYYTKHLDPARTASTTDVWGTCTGPGFIGHTQFPYARPLGPDPHCVTGPPESHFVTKRFGPYHYTAARPGPPHPSDVLAVPPPRSQTLFYIFSEGGWPRPMPAGWWSLSAAISRTFSLRNGVLRTVVFLDPTRHSHAPEVTDS